MAPPDTLINACKIVADAFERPWGSAQITYRALQHMEDEGLRLPRSSGRAYAHARFKEVAVFILGMTVADDPATAGDVVSKMGRLVMRPGLDGHPRLAASRRGFYLEHDAPVVAGWSLVDEMSLALERGKLGPETQVQLANDSYVLSITFHPLSLPPHALVTRVEQGRPLLIRFGEALQTPEESATTPFEDPRRNRGPVEKILVLDGRLFGLVAERICWATDTPGADE